jgi:FixJ family two-component response regulator
MSGLAGTAFIGNSMLDVRIAPARFLTTADYRVCRFESAEQFLKRQAVADPACCIVIRGFKQLTRDKQDVLTCVVGGQINKLIALNFDVDKEPIKVRYSRIMRKMRAPAPFHTSCALLNVSEFQSSLCVQMGEPWPGGRP